MLAFSYTRLALNNSLSCTTSYVPSPRTSSDNSKVSQKPPKNHAPNHKSALTDRQTSLLARSAHRLSAP